MQASGKASGVEDVDQILCLEEIPHGPLLNICGTRILLFDVDLSDIEFEATTSHETMISHEGTARACDIEEYEAVIS